MNFINISRLHWGREATRTLENNCNSDPNRRSDTESWVVREGSSTMMHAGKPPHREQAGRTPLLHWIIR